MFGRKDLPFLRLRCRRYLTKSLGTGGQIRLKMFREEIQRRWKVDITDARIVNAFTRDEIPTDMLGLLEGLNTFRLTQVISE